MTTKEKIDGLLKNLISTNVNHQCLGTRKSSYISSGAAHQVKTIVGLIPELSTEELLELKLRYYTNKYGRAIDYSLYIDKLLTLIKN